GSRDMLLILAENALANGDTAGFTTYINRLRAFNGLTPYSGQVDAKSLLIYERRVNLYLQGRRLTDMYRFGLKSPYWTTDSNAATCPGSYFPITITERQTNPNVTLQPACGQ
ncbi:MAG TPA: RagB/SusD family nutrient uptake outer membrane protein, partial [Gemmatimonadaceae bacterium]|nr:RagB/SusD family nutrient uptake outer membrane protein [Gemmatimonadaceae bacterium]